MASYCWCFDLYFSYAPILTIGISLSMSDSRMHLCTSLRNNPLKDSFLNCKSCKASECVKFGWQAFLRCLTVISMFFLFALQCVMVKCFEHWSKSAPHCVWVSERFCGTFSCQPKGSWWETHFLFFLKRNMVIIKLLAFFLHFPY